MNKTYVKKQLKAFNKNGMDLARASKRHHNTIYSFLRGQSVSRKTLIAIEKAVAKIAR